MRPTPTSAPSIGAGITITIITAGTVATVIGAITTIGAGIIITGIGVITTITVIGVITTAGTTGTKPV